jgi:predicted nucleotidyltransferase
MQTENKYIEQLTKSLKAINPYLVLLFGSYAYGTPNPDSDIDLLVVTNDDFMPRNFDEKMKISLKVKKHLFDINKEVAIDLIVYTKPMYQKFIELQSSFSREILSKGIIL